ncbi:MAG: hypothetical protein LBH73_00680 [Spirochaetaceae bacterium]|jgi:hypothetical protein|nr:hypothetical protein [Spirochaetaceae bacterium]
MKKQISVRRFATGLFGKPLLCILFGFGLFTGPLLSAQNRIPVRGFFANFSASYDHAFSGDYAAVYLTPYEMDMFTKSDRLIVHQGLLIQIPVSLKIFDVYMVLGATVYPFRDILSVSAKAGISVSNIILDHFTYTGNLRVGADIPVFKSYSRHFLSLGAGLRHRNGIRLFNYMHISGDYLKPTNTFFFDLAYRIRM